MSIADGPSYDGVVAATRLLSSSHARDRVVVPASISTLLTAPAQRTLYALGVLQVLASLLALPAGNVGSKILGLALGSVLIRNHKRGNTMAFMLSHDAVPGGVSSPTTSPSDTPSGGGDVEVNVDAKARAPAAAGGASDAGRKRRAGGCCCAAMHTTGLSIATLIFAVLDAIAMVILAWQLHVGFFTDYEQYATPDAFAWRITLAVLAWGFAMALVQGALAVSTLVLWLSVCDTTAIFAAQQAFATQANTIAATATRQWRTLSRMSLKGNDATTAEAARSAGLSPGLGRRNSGLLSAAAAAGGMPETPEATVSRVLGGAGGYDEHLSPSAVTPGGVSLASVPLKGSLGARIASRASLTMPAGSPPLGQLEGSTSALSRRLSMTNAASFAVKSPTSAASPAAPTAASLYAAGLSRRSSFNAITQAAMAMSASSAASPRPPSSMGGGASSAAAGAGAGAARRSSALGPLRANPTVIAVPEPVASDAPPSPVSTIQDEAHLLDAMPDARAKRGGVAPGSTFTVSDASSHHAASKSVAFRVDSDQNLGSVAHVSVSSMSAASPSIAPRVIQVRPGHGSSASHMSSPDAGGSGADPSSYRPSPAGSKAADGGEQMRSASPTTSADILQHTSIMRTAPSMRVALAAGARSNADVTEGGPPASVQPSQGLGIRTFSSAYMLPGRTTGAN